jgi:opacity protein-like surface antigen
MNTRQVGILAALALTGGALRSAHAADASPWTLSIYGGDAVGMSGKLRAPGTSSITDLGTVDPSLTGESGTLTLDKLHYDDLFRHRYDTGLELGYAFSDNLQSFGRFSYDGLAGRARRIGSLQVDGISTPAPLDARFADADNMSLDVGTRYFFSTSSPWRPYAGAALGATHLDAMRATLTVPDTTLDLQNLRFTRPGTVFSQSVETGVEYNPSSNFGVRFSVDADHLGAPRSAHDPALTEIGFDSGHDAQARWTFPVALAATYHFE